MSIGIDFVLRATTTGFTKGVATANNAIKDLKKGLKEFDVGNGLKQALGVGGVIAGFRTAIANAQELRDEAQKSGRAVSDSVRSVAAYGDALDKAWGGAKNLATETLSFFTRAGEGWGMVINRLRGVSAEQERIAEGAAKGAAEQERALDELYRKKVERAKTVDKDISDQERKNSEIGLTSEQKRNKLLEERTRLWQEIDAMESKTRLSGGRTIDNVAKKEKELKAAQLTGEIGALGQDIFKEAEDKRAKEKEKQDRKIKDVTERFAPSVEQLAAMDTAGAGGSDPRVRARQILEKERRASILGDRGDIKGAIGMGLEAQKMRDSLEGMTGKGSALTAQTAETALKNALETTNKELVSVKEALAGIIKAQK